MKEELEEIDCELENLSSSMEGDPFSMERKHCIARFKLRKQNILKMEEAR